MRKHAHINYKTAQSRPKSVLFCLVDFNCSFRWEARDLSIGYNKAGATRGRRYSSIRNVVLIKIMATVNDQKFVIELSYN